jgi:hypothetical protein
MQKNGVFRLIKDSKTTNELWHRLQQKFVSPPYNVIVEPLLQPRTCAKLFISFLYRLMEEKREIGSGTGHYKVVQMEHE